MTMENKYFKENYDKLNETTRNVSQNKARRFNCKGDIIRTEDGNNNDMKEYCAELENRLSYDCHPHCEKIHEDVTFINKSKNNKSKKIYEDDIENEAIDELLTKKIDENLSDTSVSDRSCNEVNKLDLENEYFRLEFQISEMEVINFSTFYKYLKYITCKKC